MPRGIRVTQGGQSVAGVKIPGSRRTSGGAINDIWFGALPVLPVPTFSAASQTTGGWTATITNYDATVTYSISTTSGSASQASGTITQSGLGNGVSTTVTATLTKSGYIGSIGTVSGTSTPNCSSCTYAYTQVEGGNCCCVGFCGAANQVCCYNIVVYSGSPSGCIGCAASVGSWYACDGTC
jgi:hypothetical protein